MKMLDKKTAATRVRLRIFIVVTTLATALLAITIGNISFGATTGYKAVFSDATGVVKGDDVRITGVKVGTVKTVEIYDKTRPSSSSTSPTTPTSRSTYATILYRNLIGQRYLALQQGGGTRAVLEAGRSRWSAPAARST